MSWSTVPLPNRVPLVTCVCRRPGIGLAPVVHRVLQVGARLFLHGLLRSDRPEPPGAADIKAHRVGPDETGRR
jgi:hypothetical protein